MLICLITILFLALLSGIAADTYVNILTQPGNVLDFWARWLYGLRDRWLSREPDEYSDRYQRRMALAERLLKPVLTCAKCVGGWIGFFAYLYAFYAFSMPYKLILHGLTMVTSVWLAAVAGGLRRWYTNEI